MSHSKIASLLSQATENVVSLPPIQSENTRFVAGTTPWARTTLIPSQTNPISVGPFGIDEFRGIWQIDYFTPMLEGTDTAFSVIDDLLQAFKVGTRLTDSSGLSVVIESPPNAVVGRTVITTFVMYSVQVRYSCYTQRS